MSGPHQPMAALFITTYQRKKVCMYVHSEFVGIFNDLKTHPNLKVLLITLIIFSEVSNAC